jgi:hypothetical protein
MAALKATACDNVLIANASFPARAPWRRRRQFDDLLRIVPRLCRFNLRNKAQIRQLTERNLRSLTANPAFYWLGPA